MPSWLRHASLACGGCLVNFAEWSLLVCGHAKLPGMTSHCSRPPQREPIPHGPTAIRVRRNIAALRRKRGFSLRELAARMKSAGRPLTATGIMRVESGARRVDCDDLMAFAIALEVTPIRLLLPGSADDEPDDRERGHWLTSAVRGSFIQIWPWARGDEPLVNMAAVDPYVMDRFVSFRRENRPHLPPGILTDAEFSQHYDEMMHIVGAINDITGKTGRSAGAVIDAVQAHMLRTEMTAMLHAIGATAENPGPAITIRP